MVTNVVATFYKCSFNGDDIILNRIYTSILIFKTMCEENALVMINQNNNHENNGSDSSILNISYTPGAGKCDLCFSQWLIKVGIINLMLHSGRLRHREVKRLAQGHIVDKWQSWDFNSRLGGSKPTSHWGGQWLKENMVEGSVWNTSGDISLAPGTVV